MHKIKINQTGINQNCKGQQFLYPEFAKICLNSKYYILKQSHILYYNKEDTPKITLIFDKWNSRKYARILCFIYKLNFNKKSNNANEI